MRFVSLATALRSSHALALLYTGASVATSAKRASPASTLMILARIFSAIDAADAVLVVSPIYFAGVPSQFKAVLDRFQPYFWKRQQQIEQGRPLPPKRALYVALVGEGGDPYGTAPAQAQVASPFALADFSVVDARDLIAVDEDTIVSEALQMIEQGRGE